MESSALVYGNPPAVEDLCPVHLTNISHPLCPQTSQITVGTDSSGHVILHPASLNHLILNGLLPTHHSKERMILLTMAREPEDLLQFLLEPASWKEFDDLINSIRVSPQTSLDNLVKEFPWSKVALTKMPQQQRLTVGLYGEGRKLGMMIHALNLSGYRRAERILSGQKIIKQKANGDDEMSHFERVFDRTTVKEDGQPPMAAFKFTCHKCGATDTFPLGNKGNGIAMALVQQKMRHRGWEIGNRASGDTCPDCIAARQKKRNKEPEKESNVVNFIKAEEPPTMSREDRRLIFAKIDEVYLDETTGYSDGWTDSRVAEDLGVPLAWVKTIRAENFGEERSNAALLANLEEAKWTLNEAKKIHDEIKSSLQTAMDAAAIANKALTEANDQIKSSKVSMNNLGHQIVRQEGKIEELRKSMGK